MVYLLTDYNFLYVSLEIGNSIRQIMARKKKFHTDVGHLTVSLMFLLNFETPRTELLAQKFGNGQNKVSFQNTHGLNGL